MPGAPRLRDRRAYALTALPPEGAAIARLLSPDLLPKTVTLWRDGYSWHAFGRDVLAGVVVGVVALPLAIAFAIASGVRPEQGLYTAIVAGFCISAFGGSRVQIGGPTGAFVVVVAGVVATHGYDGLAQATLMAGVLLIVMAFARLGDVMRFIPYPVTVGFTTGIAVLIAVGQLGDAGGLALGEAPADVVGRLAAYARATGSVSPAALGLCLLTIVMIPLWPRVTSRVPGPLVAIVVTTALAHALGLDVETIGSRFGGVPDTLPSLRLPHLEWARVPELASPAITIALLAAIESLLSAMVADGMIGGRHRPNAELLGQGIANLAAPLFGGIPATGAIARTATNVRNGGRTPVAGIVHVLVLLVILLAAGRWAAWIPMATLAGILLVVAYNMSEWRAFRRLLRAPHSDVLVLLTTLVLTVVVDLTVAIQVGVVLAALLFMRRMAEVTQVRALPELVDGTSEDRVLDPRRDAGGDVVVFEIQGSFCFGATRAFTETFARMGVLPRAVVLHMRDVLALDATGLYALEEAIARLEDRGAVLLIAGLRDQPRRVLERAGLLARLGPEHIVDTLAEARARAAALAATPR